MSATLEKKYLYKISRHGTYLGLLSNVKSDFSYAQLINSAGSQMTIVVGQSVDTSSMANEAIQEETGNPLLEETGNPLLTERAPDLVGSNNQLALISNDNDVEVYEISKYNPNTKLVFKGYISKWKASFGSNDDITITVLSNGQDLDNYLVPGSTPDTLDQSQTTYGGDPTGDTGSWFTGSGVPGSGQRFGQTFIVGNVPNISAIELQLSQGVTPTSVGVITVSVWNSVADANAGVLPLATNSQTVIGDTLRVVRFSFSVPIDVTSGQQLFFAMDPDPASVNGIVDTWIGFSNSGSDVYASGSMYRRNSSNPYIIFPTSPTEDFWFKTYYKASSTANTYTDTDPSDILTDIMDNYVATGGSIAKPPGGYSLTGVLATYTFNLNTALEGIKKVYDLGPANWYWYVDPATQILYYQQASATADHTFIKGRHIDDLSIEATKEDVANVIYFTGGDDGSGSNVYVNVNDTTSLVNNRRGLVRLNDPKVKGASGDDTASLLAQNYIDQHDDEEYTTTTTILASTYDISTVKIGQMVAFSGFGTFVDNLLLQIVSVTPNPDSVTLTLGVLLQRASAQVEAIQSSLQASQTTNNPDAPS